VGYRFSLVLSREITDDESNILQGAGCAEAIFGTDTLPTNAEVTVTKMDFDDTVSETLAEAIEAALEAVKNVPDLSVPGLEVPAQPATRADEESPAIVQSTVADEKKSDGQELDEAPEANGSAATADENSNGNGKKKPSTRKRAAKKPTATDPEKASVDS
jgi:metal-dependent amidase/aminoacylase/carboxypeptidase family protein